MPPQRTAQQPSGRVGAPADDFAVARRLSGNGGRSEATAATTAAVPEEEEKVAAAALVGDASGGRHALPGSGQRCELRVLTKVSTRAASVKTTMVRGNPTGSDRRAALWC